MKVGIIGAGISGLSLGQLLKSAYDVEIYECDSEIGGIAKIKVVDGIPYHMVGGHCFNSKNSDVMDFVFNKLPKEHWHAVERSARIFFKGYLIDYPIEYSISQIAQFDEDLAYQISYDFLTTSDRPVENLGGALH